MVIKFLNITIEIDTKVMELLKSYTQINGKNEAGGILLGKYQPKNEYYIITIATEPNSGDQAGKLWFNRNYKVAQKIIYEEWENTKGIVNYLGEWHTHPWKNPNPSTTDKKLIKKIILDKSNVWNIVFMIIVGLDKTFYIGAFDAENNGKIIYERIIEG